MNVQRLVHRCCGTFEIPAPPVACAIGRYRPDRDRATLVALVASGSESAATAGPRPRPAGMVAELEGRPGRSVDCWLAWQTAEDGGQGAGPALGLVTLVQSRRGEDGTRWSIGWLLVRPEARRQGVGRALVAAAIGHARAGGAEAVWTETSAAWPAAAFWRALGFEPSPPAD